MPQFTPAKGPGRLVFPAKNKARVPTCLPFCRAQRSDATRAEFSPLHLEPGDTSRQKSYLFLILILLPLILEGHLSPHFKAEMTTVKP